jgi:hypothetical protein
VNRIIVLLVAGVLLLGGVLGYAARMFVDRPSGAQLGTVTYHETKGDLVCVRPADGQRACGQYVEGTAGPKFGSLKVGDPLKYRVFKRNVSGAQLVIVVSVA